MDLINDERYLDVEIEFLNLSDSTKNKLKKINCDNLFTIVEKYNNLVNSQSLSKRNRDEIKQLILNINSLEIKKLIRKKVELIPANILSQSIENLRVPKEIILKLKSLSIVTFQDLLTTDRLIIESEFDVAKDLNRLKKEINVLYEMKNLYFDKEEIIKRNRELDVDVARRLKGEFNFDYGTIACWYGVTKTEINSKIRKLVNKGNWLDKELFDDEKIVINRMITEKYFYLEDCNKLFYIVNNMKDNLAILIVSDEGIKCFFLDDLPYFIKENIKTFNMHKFTKEELDNVSNLGQVVSILKKKYFYVINSQLFKTLSSKRNLRNNDYSQFLFGIPYADPNQLVTDEWIIDFFEKNTKNGVTEISDANENQWIITFMNQNHFNKEDFIHFYGYKTASDIQDIDDEMNYEIENDMILYSSEKLDNDYEKIFAENPLLGRELLPERTLKTINEKAKSYIEKSMDFSDYILDRIRKMVITLSVINYSREWDNGDDNRFWEYVASCFGYKDSEGRIRTILCNCIKDSLVQNQRLFLSNELGNQYKSSVMIHSFSTKKSWMDFFDFLLDFYITNLNWHYVEEDPSIKKMIYTLKSKFQNEASEESEDIEISSKCYRFQQGIKKLICYRPNYTIHLVENILKTMDLLVNDKTVIHYHYEELLCDEWYKNKLLSIQESQRQVSSYMNRNVAIDYTRINPIYQVKDTNINIVFPDIRILEQNFSSIRLNIYDENQLIEDNGLKYYGNELGKTINSFSININDYLRRYGIRNIHLRFTISCDNKVIYDSGKTLYREYLVFKEKNEISIENIKKGTYSFYHVPSHNLEFDNSEDSIIFDDNYLTGIFVELKNEYSIMFNNELIAYDTNGIAIGDLDVRFPNSNNNISYLKNGISYTILNSDSIIHIISESIDAYKKYKIILNEEIISLSDLPSSKIGSGINYVFNMKNISFNEMVLKIINLENNKLIFIKRIVFIDNLKTVFNKAYYFNDTDFIGANVLVKNEDGISNKVFFSKDDDIVLSPFKEGELIIKIPKITVEDNDGNTWDETTAYYIKNVKQETFLYTKSFDNYDFQITINNESLTCEKDNSFGIGNYLMNYTVSEIDDILTVYLRISDKKYCIGRIYTKERFLESPKLKTVDRTLVWNRGNGFIGEKKPKFKLEIIKENEVLKSYQISNDTEIIDHDFDLPVGVYQYKISKKSGNVFKIQYSVICQNDMIVGNENELRFLNRKIKITKISNGYRKYNINTCYIDQIQYKGMEETSEGYCPIYEGVLYTFTLDGIRKEFSYKNTTRKIKGKEYDVYKINPIRIIYINENYILIQDEDGEALYFYYYTNKEKNRRIYKIIDLSPPVNSKQFDLVDLYEYEIEGDY